MVELKGGGDIWRSCSISTGAQKGMGEMVNGWVKGGGGGGIKRCCTMLYRREGGIK